MSSDGEEKKEPLVSRREYIATGVGMTFAGAVCLLRAPITAAIDALSEEAPASSGPVGRAPRFLSRAFKDRRYRNRHVLQKVTAIATLLYSKRERRPRIGGTLPMLTLHAADMNGSVRLFTAAQSVGKLAPLSLAAAQAWVTRTKRQSLVAPRRRKAPKIEELLLNPRRTSAWEIMALQRVEANDFTGACDYLMAGVHHTLLNAPADPLNLRLFDLLAGLAVRTGQTERFLKPLIAVTAARLDLHNKIIKERTRARSSDDPAAMLTQQKDPSRQVDEAKPRQFIEPIVGEIALQPRMRRLEDSGLEKRLTHWRDPASHWYRRWASRSRPIWWHHPVETRTWTRPSPLPGRPAKPGKPRPETRQRPVKIV